MLRQVRQGLQGAAGDLKTRLPRLEARLGFQDEAAEVRLARAVRAFRKVDRTGVSSQDRLIV